MTEDRGQRTDDRGQRTNDRGQRTDDRGQMTEGRAWGHPWHLDILEIIILIFD
jgi:hypothetical protein